MQDQPYLSPFGSYLPTVLSKASGSGSSTTYFSGNIIQHFTFLYISPNIRMLGISHMNI